jgi:hypothetical protein
MIGTPKLVGLYVQPDQEPGIEQRGTLVPGFAVEVVEVSAREKLEGGRVFEGRIFGLGRNELKPPRPYSTPSREAIRCWWELETCGASVPEELLKAEGPSPEEERRLVS